jgi:hypothetical protein
MTTLTPSFRVESEKIHCEHEVMLEELDELDAALERMALPGEPNAKAEAKNRLEAFGAHLVKRLPGLCAREEEKLLAKVDPISRELHNFVEEMKRQHADLILRAESFLRALETFERSPDQETAMVYLKKQGRELTRSLRAHLNLEEHELSGFL